MAIKHIGLLDPSVTARVLNYVRFERALQDEEWGDQSGRTMTQWMSILMGEVGEAAQETNHYWFGPPEGRELEMSDLRDLRVELIHVAAVAVAAIQFMEKAYALDVYALGLTEEFSHHQGDAHEQH